VDEGGRLERLPRGDHAHPRRRQPTQFVVDQRQQLVSRLLITGADCPKKGRHVATAGVLRITVHSGILGETMSGLGPYYRTDAEPGQEAPMRNARGIGDLIPD
jgi:hypothetical protein